MVWLVAGNRLCTAVVQADGASSCVKHLYGPSSSLGCFGGFLPVSVSLVATMFVAMLTNDLPFVCSIHRVVYSRLYVIPRLAESSQGR